ncbi:MAG: DNA replication/repair protein RecF [Alphaproteobacteria bacterium]|nr:DNA replication/repair protein RecF [Alphaproteobacteria bacterium]
MALSNINTTISKAGVTRLSLFEYRNYESLRLNVGLNPIIITGENGSGKTNILEAISFLTPGRGLRGSKLADIRRLQADEDSNWAVAATISKGDEQFEIGTGIERIVREDYDASRSYDKRIVKIDGNKVSSQLELGRYLSAIWLTPQMDRLFRGGPQPRRSFLDRLVYDFDMEHAKRTAQFEHLYKEWYQLLKQGQGDNLWLSSLEEQMAASGVAIAAARLEQVAKLNRFIEKEPDDVFPNVRLELDGTIERMIEEKPAIEVEETYRNLLKSQRRSLFYGETVDGVNRTDFKVFYKDKKMPAELCSTGEQKSLLIGVILAQTKCQIADTGCNPVLLLDEVVSHLDEIKREALLNKIQALNLQAWITSTDAELFSPLKGKAEFLALHDGILSQK